MVRLILRFLLLKLCAHRIATKIVIDSFLCLYCRFCPSVFFYLCSVVPAIWLLEVHKFDKKLALKDQKITLNQTVKLPTDLANAFDSLGEYGVSYIASEQVSFSCICYCFESL